MDYSLFISCKDLKYIFSIVMLARNLQYIIYTSNLLESVGFIQPGVVP